MPEIAFKVKSLKLDAEQVVNLNGGVNANSVRAVIARLEAVKLMGYDNALLVINSPGGSVFDGAELVAYMKASSLKIDTYCKLLCASMGAHIHQAGRVRYMGEKSIIMFHPASGGLRGSLEEMQSMLKMITVYVERFDREAVRRSKMDFETFKKLSRDELWLEGVDALTLGFTDSIAILDIQNQSMVDLLMPPPPSIEDRRQRNLRSFR
jgi:ATP-dependent protease ClpP protease subunit